MFKKSIKNIFFYEILKIYTLVQFSIVELLILKIGLHDKALCIFDFHIRTTIVHDRTVFAAHFPSIATLYISINSQNVDICYITLVS